MKTDKLKTIVEFETFLINEFSIEQLKEITDVEYLEEVRDHLCKIPEKINFNTLWNRIAELNRNNF